MTPEMIASLVMGVVGFCLTVLSLINMWFNVKEKTSEPQKAIERRFTSIEDEIFALKEQNKRYDEYFDNDNKRLKNQEKATQILLKSMLATMTYLQSIPNEDHNAMQTLNDASKELNNYLTEKGAAI